MAEVCRDIEDWIQEEITRPVEQWVTQTQQTCAQLPWWNPLGWLCWLVTALVSITIWVVDKVLRLTVRTVCEVVAATIDASIKIIEGTIDIFVGIFTGNWARVLDGAIKFADAGIGLGITVLRAVTLGIAIDFVRDEINTDALRNYVRGRLRQRYSGDELAAIEESLGINGGVFGFRIRVRVLRTFVDSAFTMIPGTVPDLVRWHAEPDPNRRINLMELAGFEFTEYTQRFRPEIVPENITRDDLNEYLSTNGTGGRPFRIFCMSRRTLENKIDIASEKGRDIGLLFDWNVEDVHVPPAIRRNTTRATTGQEYVRINHGGDDFAVYLTDVAQRRVPPFDSPCLIPAGGVFFFIPGTLIGLGNHPVPALDPVAGVIFRDRLPDFLFRYSIIHELGHYFGLDHANGLDNIMYSWGDPAVTWVDGTLWYEYPYLSGTPGFARWQARRVWDFTIDNFPADCLQRRR